MKKLLTLLMIFCTLMASGQSTVSYLDAGLAKHKQHDFKGAIKDYTKAIKEDKNSVDAYFNRGSCELALKDYKSAMKDFTMAIKLNPKYSNAYYSRATVFASQGKYAEALPDLDQTIELDPTFPNALSLRGQIRAQTGNKKGACEDFEQAKKLGEKKADIYLKKFCDVEINAGESLVLDWPKSENWKIGSDQNNDQMSMVEYIHSDETLEKWTELGTMMTLKGAKNVPMKKAMNLMFSEAKKNSKNAKLTFIEKNDTVEYPWIIFTIESPNYKNDPNPESQLWYIVQGKQSLYTNSIAIKKATIPVDFKKKWIPFFKAGKIVTQ